MPTSREKRPNNDDEEYEEEIVSEEEDEEGGDGEMSDGSSSAFDDNSSAAAVSLSGEDAPDGKSEEALALQMAAESEGARKAREEEIARERARAESNRSCNT